MGDITDSMQLADVVSPTLQITERRKREPPLVGFVSPNERVCSLKRITRSPSCHLPRVRDTEQSGISSVYAQRHKSTPSRRRPNTGGSHQSVASPLRLVTTNEKCAYFATKGKVLGGSDSPGIGQNNDYELLKHSAILKKKESLRRLLSEMPTSPLGRSGTDVLKVSPVHDGIVAALNPPPLQVAKASIALSPLLLHQHQECSPLRVEKGIQENTGANEAYQTELAELREQLQQRETELKELMIAVLSDDLSKESAKDDEITKLRQELQEKDHKLQQMAEVMEAYKQRRECMASIVIQTDKEMQLVETEKKEKRQEDDSSANRQERDKPLTASAVMTNKKAPRKAARPGAKPQQSIAGAAPLTKSKSTTDIPMMLKSSETQGKMQKNLLSEFTLSPAAPPETSSQFDSIALEQIYFSGQKNRTPMSIQDITNNTLRSDAEDPLFNTVLNILRQATK